MANVLFENRNHIGIITFNRPETLNALSSDFVREIEGVVQQAEADPEVYVLLLTGTGKSFIAGADVSEMYPMGPDEIFEFSAHATNLNLHLEKMSKPVIAAINGYALGGGLELALACDIRIFGEKAKVGLPEVSLGITPGYGGSQRLPHIVGEGQAKRMIYTGATVRADEAYRIGLAQQVVPMGEGVNAALEIAKTIANHAPLAVAAVKRCIHASRGDREAGMAYETEMAGYTFTTEDKVEGMTAFIEKRPAEFKRR